jgi:hypothetical protein
LLALAIITQPAYFEDTRKQGGNRLAMRVRA